jgi:ubiquitin C-terminal hydrolase
MNKMGDFTNTSKLGIAGFNNMGNTCYMNSVLQLLIHCKPILNFLINNENDNSKYADYLKRAGLRRIGEKIRKDNKLPENHEITIKRSQIENFCANSIVKQLSDIINIIFKKGNSKITPGEFKSAVENKIPIFKGFQQHDAHELLLQVLDNIFEETGIESEPIINNVPDTINNYLELLSDTRERLITESDVEKKKQILQELNNFKKINQNVINRYEGLKFMIDEYKKRYNPMIYQLKTFIINTITCTECNHFNSNYEANPIITIPVKSSLDECLNFLIKDETIDDYNCSFCQSKKKATKASKIFKTPMVLFLHLKRFRQLSNGRCLKDDRSVDIPFELDLNPYCDHNMIPENNLSNKYILKGISNHHGGLGGGHYTADCAGFVNHENWYHFDDSRVSQWENNNINTSDAYLLMYEMIF